MSKRPGGKKPQPPEKYPSLESIAEHHNAVAEALRGYFDALKSDEGVRLANPLYIGLMPAELDAARDELLVEEERRTCFALLGYIEATFKAHFLYIVSFGNQSPLYKPFKRLYYSKGKNVSLRGHILREWRNAQRMSARLYDGLNRAFEFRNWFAHGRFFKLKPAPAGSSFYDYSTLYALAQQSRALCAEAAPYLS